MLEFMKKVTDWMLEKEEDAAKQCAIPLDEIQRQIEMVEKKRKKLTEQYQDAVKELDHVEEKLQNMMRDEKMRCNTNGDKS